MPDDTLNEQDTGAATEPSAEQDLSPLEALRREKDALQDRLLRTAAEFDNYRKRVERDRREQADAMAGDALAAARIVGSSRIQRSQYGMTVLTWVCWSMISEIQMA